MHTRTRLALGTSVTLAGALLGACSGGGELNQGTAVAGTMRLETFSADHYAWMPPASGTNPDPASVDSTTLSRDHWDAYPLQVPLSGAQHYPTYSTAPEYTHATRRQRGEYPTAVSALDSSSEDSRRRLVYEGFAAPLYACGDLLLLPIRAIGTPPWAAVVSPQGPVHRTPPTPAVTVSNSGLRPVPAGTVVEVDAAPDEDPVKDIPPLEPPR